MGKSNDINFKNKSINKQKHIYNILNGDEIKILNKINKKFINKIIIYFSNFIKKDIQLNFSSIQLNSYTDNDKHIKYLFSNEIEILNKKHQSFIFFSDNLLAIFIDLLFGGNGTYIEKIVTKRKITYTEKIISQKVLKLLFTAYIESLKNIFSIDMKILNTSIIDIKKFSFSKEKFITNYFNFSINGINIFLSILFPISIVKKNFKKTNSLENNKTSLIKNDIAIEKNISINELNDIELNVVTKLIMSDKVNYNSLSIGDILTIQSPNKVISYIDKIPIFLGHYKNFDKKLVVFLKKFIYKNLD